MRDLASTRKIVFSALWLTAAALTAGGVWLERTLSLQTRTERPTPAEVFAVPVPVSPNLPEGDVWAKPGQEQISAELKHFQLAGTFLTYAFLTGEGQGNPENALALVDDLRGGRQIMVRENEALGPFVVTRIGVDQLTLERDGQSWTLSLPGVLARRSTGGSDTTPAPTGPTRFEDMPALESNAFGKRVADNQWVIQRQAIFNYASDIMQDPRRAVALYQSFSQVATNEDDENSGFRLQMKGERDFLGAMGLTDQDVIRKVNSMDMKNQSRAEYLVSEFMKSRMSAVVLDIERNGKEEKLIYIIR